jgi:hypothetical protein
LQQKWHFTNNAFINLDRLSRTEPETSMQHVELIMHYKSKLYPALPHSNGKTYENFYMNFSLTLQ